MRRAQNGRTVTDPARSAVLPATTRHALSVGIAVPPGTRRSFVDGQEETVGIANATIVRARVVGVPWWRPNNGKPPLPRRRLGAHDSAFATMILGEVEAFPAIVHVVTSPRW